LLAQEVLFRAAWASTAAWSGSNCAIFDLPLSIAIVESVAAIEIAVHGWDIFEPSILTPRVRVRPLAYSLYETSKGLPEKDSRKHP